MEQYDQIGARLDRLPLARFHYRIFGIISFSLLLTGFLSYSGNVVLAKLVKRRTKNAKAFHDKCENFSFRASNETAVLITAFYSLHGDHLGYG